MRGELSITRVHLMKELSYSTASSPTGIDNLDTPVFCSISTTLDIQDIHIPLSKSGFVQ